MDIDAVVAAAIRASYTLCAQNSDPSLAAHEEAVLERYEECLQDLDRVEAGAALRHAVSTAAGLLGLAVSAGLPADVISESAGWVSPSSGVCACPRLPHQGEALTAFLTECWPNYEDSFAISDAVIQHWVGLMCRVDPAAREVEAKRLVASAAWLAAALPGRPILAWAHERHWAWVPDPGPVVPAACAMSATSIEAVRASIECQPHANAAGIALLGIAVLATGIPLPSDVRVALQSAVDAWMPH